MILHLGFVVVFLVDLPESHQSLLAHLELQQWWWRRHQHLSTPHHTPSSPSPPLIPTFTTQLLLNLLPPTITSLHPSPSTHHPSVSLTANFMSRHIYHPPHPPSYLGFVPWHTPTVHPTPALCLSLPLLSHGGWEWWKRNERINAIWLNLTFEWMKLTKRIFL